MSKNTLILAINGVVHEKSFDTRKAGIGERVGRPSPSPTLWEKDLGEGSLKIMNKVFTHTREIAKFGWNR